MLDAVYLILVFTEMILKLLNLSLLAAEISVISAANEFTASSFEALSHMCHESGLLIGSQQVSFFRTNLLFPNLPAFLFIDKTGFLIGYKNPNLPACCLRCRPPQTAQQQWRTKFS